MSLHNFSVYLFGYLGTGYAVYHILMKPTLLVDVMQIIQRGNITSIKQFIALYGTRKAYITALRLTIGLLILLWPLVLALKMAEEWALRKR